MTNKQLSPVVRAWLQRTDVGPEDVHRSTGLVSARVEQTRQRGRWWPLPPIRHDHQPPTTDQTSNAQPSPIPASNGHTPTVIGRTQSMLSPVKAITAGALVFAIGGALLIAQPFDQHGSVPGAATADPAMMTEEVEPGVERIISDGAGHDLEEKHPSYRYDMDGVFVAPDGSVWLTTSYRDTDNDANPPGALVWALGQSETPQYPAARFCFRGEIGNGEINEDAPGVTCFDRCHRNGDALSHDHGHQRGRGGAGWHLLGCGC